MENRLSSPSGIVLLVPSLTVNVTLTGPPSATGLLPVMFVIVTIVSGTGRAGTRPVAPAAPPPPLLLLGQ